MARDLRPKGKIERREGVKLFLKGEKSFSAKNPVVKRPYPPGVHGSTKKFSRLSGYGIRLREKQKAKRMYRLLEKQFHRYYLKASRQTGDTSENLLRLLETRLDNVVYKCGFADSRDQARQLVNHGHFMVNGRKVDIPSFEVKVVDSFEVKVTYRQKKYWQDRAPKLAKAEMPGWLALEADKFKGQMVAVPTKEELQAPFDPKLIIEFYSR